MNLTRTTLRLRSDLKKTAERQALEENGTLQEIFNRALEQYLTDGAKKRSAKLFFKTHDLGVPLDHLKRADFYS